MIYMIFLMQRIWMTMLQIEANSIAALLYLLK